MMNLRLIKPLVFVLLAFTFTFCDKDEAINDNNSDVENDTLSTSTYPVPLELGDGLETALLSDVSMDETPLLEMIDFLDETEDHRIHSILIMKDKKLVFEEYFEDYTYSNNPPGSDGPYTHFDETVQQYLASETKSITSTAVGIAIDIGFIGSVDDKVADYFPEYEDFMIDEKADMTIKDLLTMSSGLPFDESSYPYGDPRNGVTQLFTNTDPIQWVLEQPLDYTPGTTFFYNSGTTNVLAAIVEEAAGMYFYEFLNNFLFYPLGISDENYTLELIAGGRSFASGGLYMGSRDLLKVGYLFLNEGQWDEQSILSPEWIADASYAHIPTYGRTESLAHAYGYQWWIQDFEINGETYQTFYSAGWGGQYMYIFPEQDLIIQFFCGYFQTPWTVDPRNLIEDYILKSINE